MSWWIKCWFLMNHHYFCTVFKIYILNKNLNNVLKSDNKRCIVWPANTLFLVAFVCYRPFCAEKKGLPASLLRSVPVVFKHAAGRDCKKRRKMNRYSIVLIFAELSLISLLYCRLCRASYSNSFIGGTITKNIASARILSKPLLTKYKTS